MSKMVFVTGGVLSSLGKGIIASSIARLLKDNGLKINMMKLDPYLNVDPGTMSPIEHGEVFVTYDGGETDLDLGHYERFLSQALSRKSSVSSGQIYQSVIDQERQGAFLGKTVQVIPHITDEIKKRIVDNAKDYDLLFVELGGTVGDIESLPFLEAIRQLQFEYECYFIHGAYVPFLRSSNELKTKPVQHSVRELQSLGIRPNMIVTRNEVPLTESAMNKIANLCGVELENVIQAIDVDSVYKIPLILHDQHVDEIVAKYFGLQLNNNDHEELRTIIDKMNNVKRVCKIAIVGKYTQLADAYKSVIEAIKHACIANQVKDEIDLIDSNEIDVNQLRNYDGVVVAGGFGNSGIEGKIQAIKYVRENNIPFLGICLGMQLACVEYANNVCNLNVVHGEFNDGDKIIDIMEDQDLNQLGGTLRLGNYPCSLAKGSLAHNVYQQDEIQERHRHRYEFNNEYRNILEQNGLVFSGINKERNLVEMIELPSNKFFIASQFHPEFSSQLTNPNPLFVELVKASINK